MIDKNKVIQIALNEVGYHEKASNAFLDEKEQNAGNGNWTKYARDLDNIPGFYNGKKNGYDWCDIWVDWCFVRAYGAPIGLGLICQPVASAGAGCVYSAQYYKNVGRFFQQPQTGDQIFFFYGGEVSHTGIVVEVNQYAIITVEGNVDGQVKKCSYPHSASAIYGYGRPCWELYTEEGSSSGDAQDEPAQPTGVEITANVPVINYGDEGYYVKVMQNLLIGKGYSCGSYGADGEYGMQTKIAVYEFQKANALETDCVCEKSTWQKLLSQ